MLLRLILEPEPSVGYVKIVIVADKINKLNKNPLPTSFKHWRL